MAHDPTSPLDRPDRRSVLTGLLAAPALAATGTVAATEAVAATARVAAAGAIPTPSSIEGPYYPKPHMRLADTDTDLVVVRGSGLQAKGEIVRLRGRVLDGAKPARGARIQIWQCDANGRYLHPEDSGLAERDPGFQGFGETRVSAEGGFSFRTIKPVAYPGRTPHIHLRVFYKGDQLVTQLYVAGDARNERDTFFRRLSPAEREAVSLVLVPGQDGFDAVLDIRV